MATPSLTRFLITTATAAAMFFAAPAPSYAAGPEATEAAEAPKPTMKLTNFDVPFTYSYLAWQDKVQLSGGHAIFKAIPCNGGVGVNSNFDLSPYANCTPVYKLKTTAANTGKTIQLQLIDADKKSASWQFSLPPAATDDFVILTPTGCAALSTPNRLNRDQKPVEGSFDLAHVIGYQIQGDWGNGVYDLDIDSLQLVQPDKKMLAAREVYAKQQAEEAAAAEKKAAEEKVRLAKERQNKIWAYSKLTDSSPQVTHISMVTPDILAITIEAQRVIPATMSKYVPQEGDEKKVKSWKDGTIHNADLIRNGKRIGFLQGKNLDWFFTDEKLADDPLLEFVADDPANYTIQSASDPNFTEGVKPVALYRKSVPRDIVLPGGGYPTRHQIYLKLPNKVDAGKTYSIRIKTLNVKDRDNLTFTANLPKVRSESVHVNQIGFRPDDPVKRAFLSIWLGTGGSYTFPEGLSFSVLDNATDKEVFTGKVELAMAADGTEKLWTKPPTNYSQTAVYRMDFSSVTTPGQYRIYVHGIGCSYPFEIGPKAWEKALLVQMQGVYKQRSGVEVGPPYSDFKKPRDFHPDDGTIVTRSKYDVLEKGPNAYSGIVAADTGEVVKDAWGGYHDAGDWNPRRVTHMSTTLAQLELCEVYPQYFNALKLSIPHTEGIPDMITEALFEIDCFRRLQLPDGGVPHGIETDGDPGSGEVSWLSNMHCYVLAPTIRDSWLYAAVASRAAKVLQPIKPELSKVYLDSAIRAFDWAEKELARKRAAGDKLERKTYWDAWDARNLSSLILYDLTGNKSYHDIFMQDTCLKNPGSEIYAWDWNIQSDNIFTYARMDAAKTDPKIRQLAREGVISLAERSLQYGNANAFNLTNREPGRPMFAGFFSTAGGTELARAYYLTGKREYLIGAVQSCQFPAGCNPSNFVYTTGLGANPIKVPLELDARSSGQPVPPGLTVFGISDFHNFPHSFWDINLQFPNQPQYIWPNAYQWPLTEAYWDVWILVSANEYVIDTWAPNVLVWGYLSARPDISAN